MTDQIWDQMSDTEREDILKDKAVFPIFPKCHITLATDLPPHFEGFVGVYPQDIFRLYEIEATLPHGAETAAGLLFTGLFYPCEGTRYVVPNALTTALGEMIAVRVKNPSSEFAPLHLVLHGRSSQTLGCLSGSPPLLGQIADKVPGLLHEHEGASIQPAKVQSA